MRVQDVEQHRALVDVLDVLDLLRDVLRGRADAADGQEDVVLEEVPGEHLDVAGERGREHERLTTMGLGHVLLLDDAADLGLETHVQHAVGLVEHEVADPGKRDASALDEVDETARRRHEQVAATLDLAQLRADVGAAVDDARTNPGTIGELPRLLVDLRDELPSRGEDEGGREGLALTTVAVVPGRLSGGRGWPVDEGLREDGKQEAASLAGTGLGARHQIATRHDDGNRILLDRGRDLVARQLDVQEQVRIQRRVRELVDRFGHLVSRGFNRDVVVLLKVDSGLLLGRVVRNTEQLTFKTLVGRPWSMLAIFPLAIARATGRRGADRARAGWPTWMTVSIGIERRRRHGVRI